MKKRMTRMLTFLLCLTLPLSAVAEFAFVQLGADLYADADAQSNVVASYAAGAWVELVEGDGGAEDAGFASAIGPDGLTGYVAEGDVFRLSRVEAEQVAVVANNGKYVNLRAGASKKAQVLAKVNSGTPMLLLESGKSFDNVRVGGMEGYMASGMVKLGLKPIYTRYVESANGKGVNLRDEPTMNGAVLATAPCDSQVSVYILGNGWAYVRYGKQDGYMMSKFLTSVEPGPTYGPIPTGEPNPTYGPVPNPDPDSDFWDTNVTRYVSNGGSSVRYRSGPGGSAKVLGKASSGTEVFELSTNGAWSKITIGYGGNPVYMMSEYLVTIMPDEPDDPVVIDDPVEPDESDFGD